MCSSILLANFVGTLKLLTQTFLQAEAAKQMDNENANLFQYRMSSAHCTVAHRTAETLIKPRAFGMAE
jgi:hypothetical protein